jgi:hypothetical protein
MLTYPDLDGLTERLGALLSACKLAGYNHPNVSAALESARGAIGAALARGFDPECMQAVLDCWAASTGGPRIHLLNATASLP